MWFARPVVKVEVLYLTQKREPWFKLKSLVEWLRLTTCDYEVPGFIPGRIKKNLYMLDGGVRIIS